MSAASFSSARRAAVCLAVLISGGCGSSELPVSMEDLEDTPFLPAKATTTQDFEEVFAASELPDLPNPGRTNPFQQSEQVAVPQQPNRPQLKGFVERDEPRVVLAVGEKLGVIGVNETFEDVTVLEIRPPQVVFRQRGIEHRLSL